MSGERVALVNVYVMEMVETVQTGRHDHDHSPTELSARQLDEIEARVLPGLSVDAVITGHAMSARWTGAFVWSTLRDLGINSPLMIGRQEFDPGVVDEFVPGKGLVEQYQARLADAQGSDLAASQIMQLIRSARMMRDHFRSAIFQYAKSSYRAASAEGRDQVNLFVVTQSPATACLISGSTESCVLNPGDIVRYTIEIPLLQLNQAHNPFRVVGHEIMRCSVQE